MHKLELMPIDGDTWREKKCEALNRCVDATRRLIGADHVMIIAMFVDAEGNTHILDGGTTVVPIGELYASMASAHALKDVDISETVPS